jgi:DNA-binding transcriptional MerR regulator
MMLNGPMVATEPSIAELAVESGVEARTIRSWIAQGLLPSPLTRGPAARYAADTLVRVLAIRAMRDVMGMPLPEIRKELLVATPDQIRAHANRTVRLADEAEPLSASMGRTPAVSTAADYIGEVRSRMRAAGVAPSSQAASGAPTPVHGFEALEQRLGRGRSEPARKSRAEQWLRIPITPDLELAVRAPLDAEQRVLLERCADLIRDILHGRDQ